MRQLPPRRSRTPYCWKGPTPGDLAPVRTPPPDVGFGLRLFECLLDVGKARAAFLAGECRGLFQIFLKPCQVGTMRRRDVFQVEQLHFVGRRVHLAGEKVRVGGNLDLQFLASRSRTF